MSDIDITPVQGLDFHFSPLRWPFAADRRIEIEDYFTHLRRGRPELWNGRVLLLRDFKISDATLEGTLFEADYASFIAWRDWGYPDQEVRACFAMGALLSSDGAFLLGVMNNHTAGAGGIYFPAGMPDPRDIFFGRVDFDSNVRREIAEETGLSLDGTTADQWMAVLAEQSVALIKVFRFRKSATEMRASILDHLKNDALPELSDVHIVREPSDFKPKLLPFVRALLLHFWAHDSEDYIAPKAAPVPIGHE
jgi:8-oxo-dGTP pyrophosphatase MutT (NUDIX family)